jgi:hypothetical protein
MSDWFKEIPFRCVLSLKPIIQYWKEQLCARDVQWKTLFAAIEQELAAAPELLEPIEDLSVLDAHPTLVETLMSAVFPPAAWETHIVAAVVPMTLNTFFASPRFKRYFVSSDGSKKGELAHSRKTTAQMRLMRPYLHILEKHYGMCHEFDLPMVVVVPDEATGLDRYFRIKPNLRFVNVVPRGTPKELSHSDREAILDNITDPDVLGTIIRPEEFEFQGFSCVQAVDVTESETLRALERDIIDKQAIFSDSGFELLQRRLQTLFGRPDLIAGLAAIQGERVMLLNAGCKLQCNCIFSDSRHVDTAALKGSIFQRAAESGKIVVVRDLLDAPSRTRIEEELLASGKRSLLVVPLFHQGEFVGTLDLTSPKPGDLGPLDELLASQIQPVFAMALKRALDELDNQVDSIIKEKCTAVHPTVEWRFRDAVFEHLERLMRGEASELEPIVFKDVYPLYGSTDIRGSSEGRNQAIRADLCDHLELALHVLNAAWEAKQLPLLEELSYRTDNLLDRLRAGLVSGDEQTVIHFIKHELEPLFNTLGRFGLRTQEAVQSYEAAMDPHMRTLYRKRKDFEESVSLFNQRIAAYLQKEQAHAQSVFPHYFEKHQTDGLEYLIYVGSSMMEDGEFSLLYAKSLRLWQILLSCGIAWHAERLKSVLKVPLDTTNLILAHHAPLAVRFRFDEKRFDVDGAYDVGHEIVRSRIDKAMVKGRAERLTQPGKIAIVHSRPEESQEMVRHIHFLQSRGYLLDDLEAVELEDLPGVQGLRGLRVSVNVNSPALAARAGSATDGY